MRSVSWGRLMSITALAAVGHTYLQVEGNKTNGLEIIGVSPPPAREKENERTSAPTPAPFQAFDPLFENGVLKKQVFSSRMRLIFVVGLEGTGHHYLIGVLTDLCKRDQAACPNVCPLGKIMYAALATPNTEDDYEDARKNFRKEMQKLAMTVKELPEGEAFIATFGPCGGTGYYSYPNFNGKHKALQYVDLKILAEEAERAGIDLRVVYLSRAARSILISDTIHNHYGDTFIREARVLITDAAVMESLFVEIDPAFTTCFRYENITSKAQAERVSRFVAPTDNEALRLTELLLATVNTTSPLSGHERLRHWRKQRALAEKESWPETPGHSWSQSGGAEGLGRRENRTLGEELTQSQEVLSMRLQDKLDAIDRNLCSS